MTFDDFVNSDTLIRYRSLMRCYRTAMKYSETKKMLPGPAHETAEDLVRIMGQMFEDQRPHPINLELLNTSLDYQERMIFRVRMLLDHPTIAKVSELGEMLMACCDNLNAIDVQTLSFKGERLNGLVNGVAKRGGYKPVYDRVFLPAIEDFSDTLALAKLCANDGLNTEL